MDIHETLKKLVLTHGLYSVVKAVGSVCHSIANDIYKEDQEKADGWNLAGHKIERFAQEESNR